MSESDGETGDAGDGPARTEPLDLAETPRFLRLRAVWRFVVVVRSFLPLFAAYARDRKRFLLFGSAREVTSADRTRRAEYLLSVLVSLGPTFIKLGQMLSTRRDALPGEYTDVLSRLQDQVPPAPWESAAGVVEADLGPVEDVFDDFDTDPISGASLGQVYTARVDGDPVAVKVLRPGVRPRVEADLQVLSVLVPFILRFAREGHAFTLENVADEFAATIREEMDYAHERRRLTEIGGNFADDPDVVVPEAVDSHSSDRVLTMEYVDGTKIDDVEALDAMGVDREDLVERLNRIYIQMILEDGVFHADPHPGNLAVQDDGSIVFYDFGMTGRVDARLQEEMLEFYVGVANEDIDAIIDAFVAMDALDPSADRDLMYRMFELALSQYRGDEVERYEVAELVADFEERLYEFPLRLPRNLALIVRVSTVLEGVCQTLDPEYDLIALVSDYVHERGLEAEADTVLGGLRGEMVDRAKESAVDLGRSLVENPGAVEDLADRIEREEVHVEFSIDDPAVFRRLAIQLVSALLIFAGTISSIVLFVGGAVLASQVAFGVTVVGLVSALRARRRRKGIRAVPKVAQQSVGRRHRQGDGER